MPDSEIQSEVAPGSWTGKGVRGKFFRPIKESVTMRVDSDVIEWFKRAGDGYQTRINAALREHMERSEGRAVGPADWTAKPEDFAKAAALVQAYVEKMTRLADEMHDLAHGEWPKTIKLVDFDRLTRKERA
jgi:uncharacterized protein (DUF4415 family)